MECSKLLRIDFQNESKCRLEIEYEDGVTIWNDRIRQTMQFNNIEYKKVSELSSECGF